MKRISPAALWRLSLVGAALAVRLIAQDVMVAPLTWLDPENAPDELPVQNGFIQPEFPADLKKTSQIGWAEIDSFIDDRGAVYLREIHATLPFYEDVVANGFRKISYKPARHANKTTTARICQTILFNPASAGASGPDATPRLLSARIIVDPLRKAASEATRLPPEVVWVDVSLDAEGRPMAVSGVSARLADLIGAHLHHWRFAPARQSGLPVAANLRLPVILASPGGLQLKDMIPARSIRTTAPTYPFEERQAGVSGAVLLEFTINPEGNVDDIDVIRMTSSGFAAAARSAVKTWKFEPARVGGKPISSRVQQAIGFSLDDRAEWQDGGLGVEVLRKGDVSKMPEALRYETPPKVRRLVQPRYPYPLLADSIKGSAQIAIIIDAQGKVTASKVVRADRPEFGYALQAAVEKFEYQPALKNGDPTAGMLTVEQKFEPKSTDSLTISEADESAFKLEQNHPERVTKPGELDAKLKPIDARPPIYPRSLAEPVAGKAIVECLIGERGRVLLPRVISASQPEFGYAAVQAISGWKFEPPTSKGKPATVRVQVPIEFKPPAKQPSGEIPPAS